ncbi:MAG: tetratricopeptide repeat protein [Syntrophomonadaceae bacterium]
MKYCGRCGKQADDEARFCESCGRAFNKTQNDKTADQFDNDSLTGSVDTYLEQEKIESQSVVPQVLQTEMAAPYNEPGTASKAKGLRKKYKILIGVVLALLMAVGGFWGWQNYGTEARAQGKLDLGIKYLSENDYEKAILAFNEAIKIEPKEIKGYQALAKTYTLQGKYDDAKAAYGRGLSSVSVQNLIKLRLDLAGMFIDKKDLGEAEKVYMQIIQEDSRCVDAFIALSSIYLQQNDKTRVEDILKKGLADNAQEYRMHNALAEFYIENGRKDESISILRTSLALKPNQSEVYLLLSKIRTEDKLIELGKQWINDNETLSGNLLIIWALSGQGEYSKAIDYYNSQTQNIQNDLTARLLIAEVYARQNEKDRAREILRKMDLPNLTDPSALIRAASVFFHIGDKEEACRWAQKALELDEKHIEAYKILAVANMDADSNSSKQWNMRYLLYSNQSVQQTREAMKSGLMTETDDLIKRVVFSAGTAELYRQGLSARNDGGTGKYTIAWTNKVYLDVKNDVAYLAMFLNGEQLRFHTREGLINCPIAESQMRKEIIIRLHHPKVFYKNGKEVIRFEAYSAKSPQAAYHTADIIWKGLMPLEQHFNNHSIPLDSYIFIDVSAQGQ